MRLNQNQIDQSLKQVSQWQVNERGELYRQFVFKNFIQAFAFMTQVALIAEKQDHHPNWSNCYRQVDICLTTHEYGGLTQRDFTLAAAIDTLTDC